MEAGAGAGGSAGGNPFGGFGGFETHYYVRAHLPASLSPLD